MKKLFCIILCLCLLLCGCGGAGEAGFAPSVPSPSETEPATDSEILAYRRDVVEQQMRFMSEVLWTPTQNITYSVAGDITDPDQCTTLYAGRVYKGIPYTHGSSSAYNFSSYATSQDENGVYTLDGIEGISLTGGSNMEQNNCARLGNDCADQLFWAWAQVSSSISFPSCRYMTEQYGCLKVGDYEFNEKTYNQSTKNICTLSGEQTMFSCYAKLQKGDGLVLMTKNLAGHAVMAVSSHPEYNADGTIDGENSYIVVLEQTTSCEREQEPYYDEELGIEVYPCEITDKEWSYNYLIKKGYVPVTCKELIDPSPLPEVEITDSVETPTAGNMFTGTVKCNYRISYVTVTITQNGNVLQQATCFAPQNYMHSFDLLRLVDPIESQVMNGKLNLLALEDGDYHATFKVKIATGEEIVFRELDFSY